MWGVGVSPLPWGDQREQDSAQASHRTRWKEDRGQEEILGGPLLKSDLESI